MKHAVLVKTHAHDFTDHLNSIYDDIKCTTEGEVTIMHTQSNDEVNIGTKTNKAYRSNAHLLDTLMHYNIILHNCYNYYSCINIICNFNHL